jgi:pyridoxal phosphate enzyme (YggS family)
VPLVSEVHLEQALRVRLHEVERRLADACRRAGRERAEVTLVAVTKTVSADIVGCLHRLEVADIGESRPQELWQKAAALPASVRWHLVGHLQRNKIERTLPLVQLIHSVDSVRLLEALDDEAVKQDRSVSILLEVNASEEPQKHGFAPEEVPELLPRLAALQKIRVQGLMTMAALEASPESCRPTFRRLRALRDRLAPQLREPHALRHLSIGMSNDFEVAIEEGATLVRLGTVLFEGVAEAAP